ncbi:catalase family peroxidase [Ancylobacter sp. WKF20]|uniref:catalase family peroxidase n=1 Tax=Ancylobacter sp. WKF20 TaxID=3039801 RepID=UPI002434382C|nr:catalase family peroxidase [Ancylobacter sp. WKF20]WGD28848.1 catalase family peroxidase [Ancylobacter sp. WKF20]
MSDSSAPGTSGSHSPAPKAGGPSSARAPLAVIGSLALIGGIVVVVAGAFAYTGGFLSPGRITPTKLVDALAPPGGPALGHRRNHAKGICFTGVFEANGNGAALSTAPMLAAGRHPAMGRFNLATPDPKAPDATVRVRGLGLEIVADGQTWRAAMIDPPFFPVATPQAFFDLLTAAHSPAPEAMKDFIAAHPEFATFAGWAGSAPWTASYAQDQFNSLNAFLFTDASGTAHAVRWSYRPQAAVTPISKDDLEKLGPDHLEQEITSRVAQAPQRWTLELTVANPGDPTNDPSKAWPEGRRTVDAGTLIVDKIEPEPDGPCRDINFDPTILPAGIAVSDDPFPAARSAAYARSFNLRTAEWRDYPYQTPAAPPAAATPATPKP